MNIGMIIKDQQPQEFEKLRACKKIKKKKRKKRSRRVTEESLSTKDFEQMMKHSFYKRTNGAMRQVR